MLRSVLAFSTLLISATAANAQMNAADLKWGPAPAVFPKGAQMAVLSGDPAKTGLFTVRLNMPAGYNIPAHHHPTDEVVTVISGELNLGMGDKLDPARSVALSSGGFAQAPAGMNHYVWTKGGAVVQVSAQGPFAMTYVNPADDPTR